MRDIDFGFSLGATAALGHKFFAEGEILLLRGSVPEVIFFHAFCEEPDVFRGDVGSGLRGVEGGDFVERAHSVEELRELPLGGLKTEIIGFAPLQDTEDRFAIEYVFADDEIRVEAWTGVARETRFGNLG